MLSWAAPGNFYGAAHTVDLPLLFGDRQTWAWAGLVASASWEEVDAEGRACAPCGPASPRGRAWRAVVGSRRVPVRAL